MKGISDLMLDSFSIPSQQYVPQIVLLTMVLICKCNNLTVPKVIASLYLCSWNGLQNKNSYPAPFNAI